MLIQRVLVNLSGPAIFKNNVVGSHKICPGHTALEASSGKTESPQRKLSSGHSYMMSTDAKKVYGNPGPGN